MLRRSAVLASTFAVTLGLGASFGCSSGSSAPPGPETSIARAEWCGRQAKVVCEKRVSCCTAAAYPADLSACVTRETGFCEDIVKAEEAQGAVYDPSAAALCLPHLLDDFQGC